MTTDTSFLAHRELWRVDPARSMIVFSVRDVAGAAIRGGFDSFSGTSDARSGDARVRGVIDVASLSSDDAARDHHLRAELLDAERWPHIIFSGHAAGRGIGGEQLLACDVTIRYVTHPVVLTVTTQALDPDTLAVGVDGRISRSAFGLDAGPLALSDGIAISAQVVLERAAA